MIRFDIRQIHDEPQNLRFVSPCMINEPRWMKFGSIFAELEASFSNTSLSYHVIAKFLFDGDDLRRLSKAASVAVLEEQATGKKFPMRIITR